MLKTVAQEAAALASLSLFGPKCSEIYRRVLAFRRDGGSLPGHRRLQSACCEKRA